MTSRNTTTRHRAEDQRPAALAAIAKAVSGNAAGMGRQAAVVVAASGLVLASGVAANAGDVQVQREAVTSTLEVQAAGQASLAVQASSQVQISFERPGIASEAPAVEPAPAAEAAEAPAPAAPAPAAPVQAAAPAAAPVQAASVQKAPVQAAAPAAAPVQAAAPAPAPAAAPAAPAKTVPASGLGATIAAAAYAQLGVAQDCTALASNALRAAGINFHDWPAGYLSLGQTVSAAQAQPGDLIYYADGGMGLAHIAVYVGNGMAVHGGWNGGTTQLFSANVGSGPVFIRVAG